MAACKHRQFHRMNGDEFGYSTFMSKGDRPRAVVSLGFMFHGLRVGLRTSSSKSSLGSRVWIFHLHVEGRSPASGGLTRFSCVMDCVCDCVHHPQSRVWIFHLHVEGRLPASGGLTRFRSASDFCGQGETADVTMRLVFKPWFMSLSKWIGDGSCYETWF